MDQILISVETLNRLLGYLGSRPYQEVFQVIEMVQRDAANQAKPAEAEPFTVE